MLRGDVHTNIDADLDYLTGLANRGGLYVYYSKLANDKKMHYLFLDLDDFKSINDVYGHSVGDDLLVMVGGVLRKCSPNAFIARIGGDEFVMILPGEMTEQEVRELTKQLTDNMVQSDFRTDVKSIVTVSIGVVYNQNNNCVLDDILNKCDTAMYRAKKLGKSQFVVYNDMEAEIELRKRLEKDMRKSIKNNELFFELQPKMNMLTSQLSGAEVLMRWNHPKLGRLYPDDFLSIMENNGFIVEADMFILEEVCKMKKAWKRTMLRTVVLSLNLSSFHFYREDFIDRVVAITKKYGIKPAELMFELKESIFLGVTNRFRDKLKKLKELGFHIAIDNFGSGYSSLNMLRDVPADVLKIDGDFLKVTDDERTKIIFRNMIIMGKDLKLELIAEGVENHDQVVFLTGAGCELAQGHYYREAVSQDEFVKYARKHIKLDERVIHYRFMGNLKDDRDEYEGLYNGKELQYSAGPAEGTSAILLPGGEIGENQIDIPSKVICTESYTFSMWVKVLDKRAWSSIYYAEYDNGFASLVASAWEGTSVYRVKDARDVGGWYDTPCCSLKTNEWIFICITYDEKSEMSRYYVNGIQNGYQEHVPSLRVPKKVTLGGDSFQKSFYGYISDLILFDAVKSAQDIAAMYESYGFTIK